jgi:hypothetical protein
LSGLITSVGGEGKTTAELQCPTMPGDMNCDSTLYADWDNTVWNFDTSSDYPRLIVDNDGDTDGDGVADHADTYPLDPTEWADTDGDGIGDNADVFPNDGTEWVDTDGDGVGDNSDVFVVDVTEWADSDGDGVGDNLDAYPNDPNEWLDENNNGMVDVDRDGLIDISTVAQLDLMRSDLSGTSLDGDTKGCPVEGCNGYELVADLDFDTNGNGVADDGDEFWNNGDGWLPIEKLTDATFEGNNHSISNLYINRSGSLLGLWSVVNNSAIRNVALINPLVNAIDSSSKDSIGILSGYLSDSTVSNISVQDGSIAYNRYLQKIGLLIGRIGSTSSNVSVIEDINVSGSILPYAGSSPWNGYLGGLVGYAYMSSADALLIRNVVVDATLSGKSNVGGIIGSAANVNIDQADVAINAVCSSYGCGGVLGQASSMSLSNVRVSGELTGLGYSATVGGIAGYLSNSSVTTSSFVGTAYSSASSSSSGVGGLLGVGNGITLTDSFTLADVSGNGNVGGLIGTLYLGTGYTESLISRNYAASTVSGAQAQGGLIGATLNNSATVTEAEIAAAITSSYWDAELSGLITSVGGEGKTTAELQCPTMPGDMNCDSTLYADWDNTVWSFDTSSDYPVLH